MYQSFSDYMRFYKQYALESWADLEPSEYGVLLICIGVFGWLLMKNGARR
jgi:hypothetical protein